MEQKVIFRKPVSEGAKQRAYFIMNRIYEMIARHDPPKNLASLNHFEFIEEIEFISDLYDLRDETATLFGFDSWSDLITFIEMGFNPAE